ncbi:MAG: peptidoglycan D,D-transpeptidase FtsI family protein [Planctomycetota bacterium]|jgi:cell division protein FtsI (penicillin-binding protein 3)
MNANRRQIWIMSVFLTMIVLAFGALFWRVFDLKYNDRDAFQERSQRQLSAFGVETPRRGQILDSQGRVLAASIKTYNAFVEPRVLNEYPDQILVTASTLQDILEIPGPEICRMIAESKNPGFVKIKSEISDDQRQLLQAARLRGLGIDPNWDRLYPAGNLTGHLLGFVGADDTGLSGLELRYDNILAGKQGKHFFVVDVGRDPIGAQTTKGNDAEDGLNLVLTVDSVIQRFVHEALQQKMEEYEAESAVAVVMDPWTGGIMAMVSLPDYDPAAFSTTPQDKMRNRALTDPFEPGSIFKPLVATMALDSGMIGYEEKFDCENGQWSKYGGIGEYGNHEYGMLTAREIIIHSSNIGMAKIGLKMGQENLYDGLKLFGFSSRTGIDLPGEEPGLVWSLPKWSRYSVTRIPFGHEVMVTPIQICRAYSILANGGYVVKPHVVRAVVDGQGRIVEDRQPPKGMGYIIKTEVAEWMVQTALSDVVNEGTGDKAKLENCQVWGKTGTANIATDGHYDWKNYVASFVGGAPAEKPAVVVMVSIRKPKRSLGKGYSGGRVAAPVVGAIIENTLRYLGVTEPATTEPVMAESLTAAR